jgi:hypothetical protein
MINHLQSKGHGEEWKEYNDDDKKTVLIQFISIRNLSIEQSTASSYIPTGKTILKFLSIAINRQNR